jgi:predicted porin
MWSGSVQWSGMGGRVRVGGAIDRHKDFTTVGLTDGGYSVKGGFNAGVVDIGLAWESMSYRCGNQPFGGALPALCSGVGTIKARQTAVALAVPVGPGSIRASYAIAKDLAGVVGTPAGGGRHISDTGAKEFNVGYEHRFSKRTNVGLGYAKVDNKANAAFTWTGAPPNQLGASNTPLFGSDVSTFFLSMTHRF